jgi:hypothetical protein
MRASVKIAAITLSLWAGAAAAQPAEPQGLGEVMVTSNRTGAPFAQQDRPVAGLRRTADAAVMSLVITSDHREAETRKQEIHTVLRGAMDKAAASGFEIVSGSFRLEPVSRQNYESLPLQSGGRVDTSQVRVLVKTPLAGTAAETEARLRRFIGSLSGSGRATVEYGGGWTLTVVNPDQYRDSIIGLVAEDAKHSAALFGPDFTVNITGIDGQVAWSQISSTEVFLYIPYRYTIVPKQ